MIELFPSIYKFYDLPEEKRVELIGQTVKGYSKHSNPTIYYVVGLRPDCFNYGIQQGLISLHMPTRLYCSEKTKVYLQKHRVNLDWFKIGAFSPDDLDLDLEFNNVITKYQKVKRLMDEWAPTFFNTSYKDILNFVYMELGGERYFS